MPAIKTVILFGQYSVPVSLAKATVDTDLQLHEYHIEDHCRTCRKTLCSGCGSELKSEDIVKGFEYEEHCVVLITKDDIRQLKTEAENCIDVLYSTSLDQISPVYFSTSYFASPESGSEKTFEALRLALQVRYQVLIGRAISGGIDSYVAITPLDDCLLVSKLYLDSEINKTKKPYMKPSVLSSDLEPVKSTLDDMYSAFDLSAYENGYQNKLRDLIAAKITESQDTYNIR